MPRRDVGGSFCRKNRANSKLPASGPVLLSTPKRLSPAERITEKLYSLKQNRAGAGRREVTWNQERNGAISRENAVRALN
jgi:hypothetical protein